MRLFLVAALFAANVFGAAALTTDGAYELNKRSSVDRKYATGTKAYDAQQFGAKGTWSFSDQGGVANAILPLHDHDGKNVTLPAGAIIRDCLIDVVTQPVSSTGSSGIAFSSKAVADLKAATFPASLTTTTPIVCIPIGTVGTMIKTASELTLAIKVGSEALTAGKINVWVEYVLSE